MKRTGGGCPGDGPEPRVFGFVPSRTGRVLGAAKTRQGKTALFQLRNQQPFAFTGLLERWSGLHGDGRGICTILNPAANDLVRPMHDRMPVILPLAFHDEWLTPNADAPQWLQSAFFRGVRQEELEAASRAIRAGA